MNYFFKTAQQYDNLWFFADKIDIFLWSQPYKKQKHGEQLIYLDRRMVTKIIPAECSEGYLRINVPAQSESSKTPS